MTKTAKTTTAAAYLVEAAWREDDGSLPFYVAGFRRLRTRADAEASARTVAAMNLYDAVRVINVRDRSVVLVLNRD
jgi:hypothetical protein